MTILNLTEAYLNSRKATWWEQIQFRITPDVYYASSLYKTDKFFQENTPKKKQLGFPSALVILKNLEIKEIESSEFNFVLLGDATYKRIVGFEEETDFYNARNNFRVNKNYFVTVPEVWLQYRKVKDINLFTILSLEGRNKPKRKSLKELLKYIPNFSSPVLQPQLI